MTLKEILRENGWTVREIKQEKKIKYIEIRNPVKCMDIDFISLNNLPECQA